MPEETAQVPTPENKTSVLDKNVPNPLAKNPNVHTHKVFASVGLILIGVIVILTILGYFYRDQVTDFFKEDSGSKIVETTKISTSSATAETSAFVVPKDWKTYNASNGMSFKYPPNWTINKVDKTSSSLSYVVVKSPNGFLLNFVDSEEVGDLGGGCGDGSDSSNNDFVFKTYVYSKKPIGLKDNDGKEVRVVEWSVSGGSLRSKGMDFQRKEVILDTDRNYTDFPKLGDNGEGCLLYEDTVFGELLGVFFSVGKGARFQGRYPDDSSYQKLSAEEYFKLEEVKTAETILASVKLPN